MAKEQDSSAPAAAKGADFYHLYSDVSTTDAESEGEHEEHHHAHPHHIMPEVTPELLNTLMKQVEFYFSDANLPTDKKLLKLIRKDAQGFVPVKLFANFRKIRAMTRDVGVIATALKSSQELVMSADARCVKRLVPVPEYDFAEIQKRILVVENLTSTPTIDSVNAMFHDFGSIKVVRICSRENKNKLPNWLASGCSNPAQQHAFVEFEDEEAAVRAAAAVFDESDSRHELKVQLLVKQLALLQAQRDEMLLLEASGALSPPHAQGSKREARTSHTGSKHDTQAHTAGGPANRPLGRCSVDRPLGRSSVDRPLGRCSADHPAQPRRDRNSLERHSQDAHGRRYDCSGGSWGHEPFFAEVSHKRQSHDGHHSGSHDAHHGNGHDAHHGNGHDAHHGNGQHDAHHHVADHAANGHGDARPGVYMPPSRRCPIASSGLAHFDDHHHGDAKPGVYTPPSRRSVDSSPAREPAVAPATVAAAPTHERTLVAAAPTATAPGSIDRAASPVPGAASALSTAPEAASGAAVAAGSPAATRTSPLAPVATKPAAGSEVVADATSQAPAPAAKQQQQQQPKAAGSGSQGSSHTPSPRVLTPSSSGKGTTQAALSAMLADVIAAAERKQKEMDAAVAAGSAGPSAHSSPPPMAADGGIVSHPLSPTGSAAAAAPAKDPHPAGRSSRISAGGGANKGSSRGVSPAPSPRSVPLSPAMADVDSFIHKILSGIPAGHAHPATAVDGAAALSLHVPAAAAACEPPPERKQVSFVQQERDEEDDEEDNEARRVDEFHHGRALSVVSEGNELERTLSAPESLHNSTFAADSDEDSGEEARGEAGRSRARGRPEAAGKAASVPGGLQSCQVASDLAAVASVLAPAPDAAGELHVPASTPIAISKPPLPASHQPHKGSWGAADSGSETSNATGHARSATGRHHLILSEGGGGSSVTATSSGEESESSGGRVVAEAGAAADAGGKRRRRKRNSQGGNASAADAANAAGRTPVSGPSSDADGADGGQRRRSHNGHRHGSEDGGGSEGHKGRRHSKKDYASWAAATPEYRAEASSAKHAPGGGSPPGPSSILKAAADREHPLHPHHLHHLHTHTVDSHLHGVHASRGPDGSRGFAMGRGRPMPPPIL